MAKVVLNTLSKGARAVTKVNGLSAPISNDNGAGVEELFGSVLSERLHT